MRIARETRPDGTSRLVDAQGQPLGSEDIDQAMLHVIPRLYVPDPDPDVLDAIRARLTLTVHAEDGLPIAPDPEAADGGVVVRNPYPNPRYFVGGSHAHRNGWLVPLADGCVKRVFCFRWTLQDAWEVGFPEDDIDIVHHITVLLRPGAGRLYTMDTSCWPDDARMQTSMDGFITPLVSPTQEVPSDPAWQFRDGEWQLTEEAPVPGIPREQAYALEAFEEENLHEVPQTALFPEDDPDREAHRANAPIEMPVALLVQAVHLARQEPKTPRQPETPRAPASCEQHPAVRLLCDWWDTARPAGEPLRPGAFALWVRVRPDGQYWAGHHETPNLEVRDMNPDGTDCARVGDALLVLFYAEQAAASWGEDGVTIYLPSGDPYMTVGVDHEDFAAGTYDEAWYSLEALRAFPERFPALWAALSAGPHPQTGTA